MKHLLILIILIQGLSAQYSNDFLKSSNRSELEQKFNLIESRIRTNEINNNDKLFLLNLLYDLKDDPRGSYQSSYDVINSPVGHKAVILMAKLCKYEDVLSEGKNIDLTDPFRPDPYNDYNKDEFLSWYEKEYLPNKNLENQERLEKASSKPDKPKPFLWWLLGVVGLIVVLGFMLLKGKSKR